MRNTSQHNQYGPKNRHGFTLIELLVVISIISLLISILLPALGAARKAAMAIKCAANYKQISTCIAMYQTENNNKYMACDDSSGVKRSWDDMLYIYDSRNLTPTNVAFSYIHHSNKQANNGMYQCPSDSISYRSYEKPWYIRSYSLTHGKSDENRDTRFLGIFGLGSSKNWSMDPSQIRNLSKTVLGMEYWTKQNFLGSTTDSLSLYWTDYYPAATHPGETLNYLFADSHVQRLKKDVVYNNASPTWSDYTGTLFDCRR